MTTQKYFTHSYLIVLALVLLSACGNKKAESPPPGGAPVIIAPTPKEPTTPATTTPVVTSAKKRPTHATATDLPVRKAMPPATKQPAADTIATAHDATKVIAGISENLPDTKQEPSGTKPAPSGTKPTTCPDVETTPATSPPPTPSHPRYFALKTNLAGWATGAINLAADVQIDRHISIELPIYYSPLDVSPRYALRQFTIQPEARYWFNKPGKGHFAGLHAHWSWYNAKWDDYRYQSNEALYGIGLSYGYQLPLTRRWGMEFNLGAGYINTHYDTYYNTTDGMKLKSEQRTLWSITRLAISFVYRIN